MKRLLLILFAIFLIASPVQGEFFKDIIVTSPTGIWTDSRAYTTLGAAITAIGASEQDLYIAKEEVVTTLVIPANIRLHFVKDGSIANSNTLTINTRNIHSDHQIFTGAGAVNFIANSEVRSRWFEDFETAVTQTSNDTVTLTVDTADTLLNSAAVGDNVLLKWNASNLITIAAGQTLSNIGDISAPSLRLFVISGNITFRSSSSIQEVDANWFGSSLTTLGLADTAAATAGKSLTFSGPWVIDTDLTLSSHIKALSGTDLQIATGKTLTINGPLEAGRYKIFSCTGTGAVVLGTGSVKEVYPQWWGTNQAALSVADIAAAASTKPLIISQSYSITTPLTLTSLVQDGRYQIFNCSGAGAVTLTAAITAYPQWWGTNVTASVNAALASSAGVVDIGSGTYVATTTVLWDISKCALVGNGAKFDGTGNAGITLSVYNNSAGVYDYYTFPKRQSGGFEVVGDRTTYVASVGIELGSTVAKNTGKFSLNNVAIHNFNIGLHFNPPAWVTDWFACSFDKLTIYDCNYGVKAVFGGERNYFNECTIHDNVQGFYVSQGDWTLTNCNLDYNHNRTLHAEGAARIDMIGGHIESSYDVDYWLYCTGGSTRISLKGTSITNGAATPKTKEIGLADDCGAEGIVFDSVVFGGGFLGGGNYPLLDLVKVTDYTGRVSFRGLPQFVSSAGVPVTEMSQLMLSAHLNYLLDGGFETAYTSDWTASSGAGYVAPALDAVTYRAAGPGVQSLKFAPTAGNQTQIIRSIPCRVGGWGRMSFWIKNDFAAAGNSTDNLRIEAGYLSADGSEVPLYSQVIDLSLAGTHYDDWTQLWLTPYLPAPAGAVSAYFKFKVGTGASDGKAENWIDDVQINMWIK